MIELAEGFYCRPKLIAVVKSTGVNECALFTAGQSATDGGFKLDYDAKEVAAALDEDEEENEEGDDEDEKDDEEEEDD